MNIQDMAENHSLPALAACVTELIETPSGHRGCCPFHQEPTGSFVLESRSGKWRWICVSGCGQGDTLSFLSRLSTEQIKSCADKVKGREHE